MIKFILKRVLIKQLKITQYSCHDFIVKASRVSYLTDGLLIKQVVMELRRFIDKHDSTDYRAVNLCKEEFDKTRIALKAALAAWEELERKNQEAEAFLIEADKWLKERGL